MKICHVTFDFPPTIGGTETHNYSLVRYLLEKSYDALLAHQFLPKNLFARLFDCWFLGLYGREMHYKKKRDKYV